MLVKSVFTVISVYETKIARKNFSEISDTKGGNQLFKVGVGEKKGGGTQIFSKIKGGEPDCPLLWSNILPVLVEIKSNVRQVFTVIFQNVLQKSISYHLQIIDS